MNPESIKLNYILTNFYATIIVAILIHTRTDDGIRINRYLTIRRKKSHNQEFEREKSRILYVNSTFLHLRLLCDYKSDTPEPKA